MGGVKIIENITHRRQKVAPDYRFREGWLYIVFCGITLILGIALIYGVGGTLREDPLHVYETAMELNRRENTPLLPGGYLFHKAHQLCFVTYERILGLFSTDVGFFFLANLLMINGINFLTYKLADLCFNHNRRVNVLTICLSYLFVPQFFFVVFAYGLVPGFFFLLLGIYFALRYFNEQQNWQWIIVILAVSIASLLKFNYLIGAIAVSILCVLHALKEKKGRFLLVAMTAIAIPVLVTKVLPSIYEARTGMPMSPGEPMITYVAMGVNPMNEGAGPGWYDGSNYNWFKNAQYNQEATIRRAKECLQNCLIIYKNEPVRSVRFFIRKTISQWCDPLFQSIWSGPLEALGQKAETPGLQELYRGEGWEPYLCTWMKGMLLLVYTTAFTFLITHRKGKHDMDYAFLFFLGGFIFHFVWEAKSQYIYPYVFVLIPACAYVVDVIIQKKSEIGKSKT